MMNDSRMNMNLRKLLTGVLRKLLEFTRIESWPEEFAVIPLKKTPRSGLPPSQNKPRGPKA